MMGGGSTGLLSTNKNKQTHVLETRVGATVLPCCGRGVSRKPKKSREFQKLFSLPSPFPRSEPKCRHPAQPADTTPSTLRTHLAASRASKKKERKKEENRKESPPPFSPKPHMRECSGCCLMTSLCVCAFGCISWFGLLLLLLLLLLSAGVFAAESWFDAGCAAGATAPTNWKALKLRSPSSLSWPSIAVRSSSSILFICCFVDARKIVAWWKLLRVHSGVETWFGE
ncbi:hypothetical protein BDR26DRAFT_41031 [Obelidium mucronatum]|nr:hypothetical protein BDR26DRAFT_41031 [Obelidium mucronatum]